jgi:hypothetical protein
MPPSSRSGTCPSTSPCASRCEGVRGTRRALLVVVCARLWWLGRGMFFCFLGGGMDVRGG